MNDESLNKIDRQAENSHPHWYRTPQQAQNQSDCQDRERASNYNSLERHWRGNNNEGMGQQGTTQLQKLLDLEAILRRISDDVRDTLDEKQILQTIAWELAIGLNLYSCNIGLYDAQLKTSTIAYEYNTGIDKSQGQVIQMLDFPEGYQQLLQGQYFQFCELIPHWRIPVTILACPIFGERGAIGDLWLFRQPETAFDESEIRLVEQVANQCAIAIRQARLDRSVQAKSQELKTLHRLKNDFLDMVSHELRTPLANMKMAIEMLNLSWQRQPKLAFNSAAFSVDERDKIDRYLQILHQECERELKLIDNLLDVQHSDFSSAQILTAIRLQEWLPSILIPFQERSRQYRQSLSWEIPPDLPRPICEATILERILTELLNNACKYTPAGESIFVKVAQNRSSSWNCIDISTINTGVEIPPQEQDRIFEKFYRIQAYDFWNQGGTGIGLAIVKRLVAQLGGKITVASAARQTSFTIELPLK